MHIETINTILGVIISLSAVYAIIIKPIKSGLGINELTEKLDDFINRDTDFNDKMIVKLDKVDEDIANLHSDFRLLSDATKAQLRVEVRRIYYKGKQRGDQLKQYEADTLADIEQHYIALGDGDTEINVLLAQMKEWERVLN